MPKVADLPGMRFAMTIQTDTGTQSDSGETTPNWTTYYANWYAKIIPLSGNEGLAAREIYGTVSHRLEGRWVTGVTPKMRVIRGGRTFRIEAAINVEERNRELHLFCTEEA